MDLKKSGDSARALHALLETYKGRFKFVEDLLTLLILVCALTGALVAIVPNGPLCQRKKNKFDFASLVKYSAGVT